MIHQLGCAPYETARGFFDGNTRTEPICAAQVARQVWTPRQLAEASPVA